MINVIISGCNGKMGHVVAQLCQQDENISVAAGFDVTPSDALGFPVFTDPMAFSGPVDCVIDFSHPSALPGLLGFCKKSRCGLVLATTGYSAAQEEEVRRASEEIRIFRSANMSLGINVLLALVRQAARVLGDGFDLEIVEKHHNRKLDAPSGTALMIAEAASSALPCEPEYVYDRHERRAPRGKREIGISAVRGGTIVGEHEVIFAGTDEVLEIKHTAYSREVFAAGAVKAAKYLSSLAAPGLYNMEHLVSEVI